MSSPFLGAAFELMASLPDLAYCLLDYCSRHGYAWTGTSVTMTYRLGLAGPQPCPGPVTTLNSHMTLGLPWSPSLGLPGPMGPWLVRTESHGHPGHPAPVEAAGQCCGLAATQDDQEAPFGPDQCLDIYIPYTV